MDVYLSYSFFFFKQKTAYEVRISDWSSDVCSSDLPSPIWRGEGSSTSSKSLPARRHRPRNHRPFNRRLVPQSQDGGKAAYARRRWSALAAATWFTASSSGRRRIGVPGGKAESSREGQLGDSITNWQQPPGRGIRGPKR